MANDYLSSILNQQNQKAITGGGTLTPEQISAISQGQNAAIYQSGTAQAYEANAERATTANIAHQQFAEGEAVKAREGQEAGEKVQAGVGVLGLGVSAYNTSKTLDAISMLAAKGTQSAMSGGLGSAAAGAAAAYAPTAAANLSAYATTGATTGAITNIGSGVGLTAGGSAVNLGATGASAAAASEAAASASVVAAETSIWSYIGESILALFSL